MNGFGTSFSLNLGFISPLSGDLVIVPPVDPPDPPADVTLTTDDEGRVVMTTTEDTVTVVIQAGGIYPAGTHIIALADVIGKQPYFITDPVAQFTTLNEGDTVNYIRALKLTDPEMGAVQTTFETVVFGGVEATGETYTISSQAAGLGFSVVETAENSAPGDATQSPETVVKASLSYTEETVEFNVGTGDPLWGQLDIPASRGAVTTAGAMSLVQMYVGTIRFNRSRSDVFVSLNATGSINMRSTSSGSVSIAPGSLRTTGAVTALSFKDVVTDHGIADGDRIAVICSTDGTGAEAVLVSLTDGSILETVTSLFTYTVPLPEVTTIRLAAGQFNNLRHDLPMQFTMYRTLSLSDTQRPTLDAQTVGAFIDSNGDLVHPDVSTALLSPIGEFSLTGPAAALIVDATQTNIVVIDA